ncbi:hypothetical protein BY996DRAFT_6549152 [Phakopsora pachyrhizi]|nr:hypothetical protein BY996DRAFT_6549152 [Phakopsora pachyrhizi]
MCDTNPTAWSLLGRAGALLYGTAYGSPMNLETPFEHLASLNSDPYPGSLQQQLEVFGVWPTFIAPIYLKQPSNDFDGAISPSFPFQILQTFRKFTKNIMEESI